MSEKHTPGRLMTQVESYAIADTGDYEYTYNIRCAETLKLMAIVVDAPDEKDEANARRLVACWNALDGISTTEIEAASRSGSIAYALETLISQRDELLGVLNGVATMARCGQLDRFIGEPWLDAVFSVIAKAEGGAG